MAPHVIKMQNGVPRSYTQLRRSRCLVNAAIETRVGGILATKIGQNSRGAEGTGSDRHMTPDGRPLRLGHRPRSMHLDKLAPRPTFCEMPSSGTRASAEGVEQTAADGRADDRESFDEAGTDLTLIRSYLDLTPLERLRSLQNCVRALHKFRPLSGS